MTPTTKVPTGTHLERHFLWCFMKNVNKNPRKDSGADDDGEADYRGVDERGAAPKPGIFVYGIAKF